MWFVLVLIGLALLTISGLYVRRRLGGALAELGVSARAIRVMRWVMGWLMWGHPSIVILTVVAAVGLGWSTLPRYDGWWASLMLGLPFFLTVLIVLQSVVWIVAIDLVYVVARRGTPTARRARSIAVLIAIGAFALYTPIRIIAERGVVRMRPHRVGRAAQAHGRCGSRSSPTFSRTCSPTAIARARSTRASTPSNPISCCPAATGSTPGPIISSRRRPRPRPCRAGSARSRCAAITSTLPIAIAIAASRKSSARCGRITSRC
jgi:hypothetical protein